MMLMMSRFGKEFRILHHPLHTPLMLTCGAMVCNLFNFQIHKTIQLLYGVMGNRMLWLFCYDIHINYYYQTNPYHVED